MWVSLPFKASNCDGGIPSPNKADGYVPLLEEGSELALEDLALLFEALGSEDFSGVAAVHPRQQVARTNEGTQQAVPIKVSAEIANPPTTEQIARFPIAS